MTTTDLSDFGYRELEELKDLLDAWIKNGLPSDFDADEVVPMMNRNSGYVFLTNSEYQVAMVVDGKLESFYTLPYSGKEGFLDDLIELFDEGLITEEDDLEYLADICDYNGESDKAEEMRAAISE